MRKIISKEKSEKKSKRNQMAIGLVLILIMFFSLLGYSFNRTEEGSEGKIIYNGIEFLKEQGLWKAKIENLLFSFQYNPNEVNKINSILNPIENYYDKPLYIYSESSDAGTEIYRNLFYHNQIIERMQYACLEEEKCEENYPVKDCTNNFIIIKEGENTEVRQQDNCVFIEGKEEELIKLTDSFLFRIIGVQ
ncbi:hypothetical protein M0R19_06755 [Candidatus Pacearchaeota archaeon]|nr:hypothetical protein [Candidatus Pacearchaeota archaeon]